MFKAHYMLVSTNYSSFISPDSYALLTPFKMAYLLFPEHPSQFYIYVSLSFDYLDNSGFFSRSCPVSSSQWTLPHIPRKGSFPLCESIGICSYFQRFCYTLLCFVCIPILSSPQPPSLATTWTSSPWCQGYIVSHLWISKIWHSAWHIIGP